MNLRGKILVVAATMDDEMRADIACAKLMVAGIPSEIAGDHLSLESVRRTGTVEIFYYGSCHRGAKSQEDSSEILILYECNSSEEL
ncbi:MAG: hypothetical protein AAB473_02790 [Patescibacteria group bacterium]